MLLRTADKIPSCINLGSTMNKDIVANFFLYFLKGKCSFVFDEASMNKTSFQKKKKTFLLKIV